MSERSAKAAPAAHESRGARREAGPMAAPSVADPARRLASTAGNRAVSTLLGQGRPLADELRLPMEARFGADFSGVRIHDHPQAHASARAHGAKAYAHGEDIVFGAQRFVPQSPDGRHLLAHELAHVVQQRRGGAAPGDGTHSATEQGATAAADAISAGSGPVAVSGASGVGVACEKDDEEDRRKGQASTTVLAQKARKAGTPEQPIQVVKDPNKGKGTGAEATVPFDRYAGPDWNHIGGGSETGSSRTSLARRSSVDVAAGREEGSAGIDFLVENVKTDRLVIGEQKATQGRQFNDATAITVSLEKNVAHTVEVLKARIKSGDVHPEQVPALERTIARLEATHEALVNRTELPEGVVFELTNVNGEGEQIGKGHIDLLAEKYGKTPGFLEHLLSRTFVRDAALAKAKGRDPTGKPGTDADPAVVPATDLLNEPARNELARLKAGKSPAEWDKQQASEKAALDKQQAASDAAASKARLARQKQETADRNAAKKKALADARSSAETAKLNELRDARKQNNEPEPKSRTARDKRDSQDNALAKKAGKAAHEKALADQKAEAARIKADATAKRAAEDKAKEDTARDRRAADERAKALADAQDKALADARKQVEDLPPMTPEQWSKLPPEQRKPLEQLAAKDPALAAQLNKKVNAEQTQAFENNAKKNNNEAEGRNRRNASEEKMGAAAHRLNQAAGAVRGVDAFLDARDRGEGYGSALFEGGKTYLENTNQLLGGIATFESRMQQEKLPDGRTQQYYGEDAGDAFFGTLGENIGNAIVPGKGWDQLVNGGANLIAAGDDHLKRDLPPGDPRRNQANLRTGTDLAAELTPSRMFATTVGAGMRAYFDIGKAIGGQPSGVDKFGDDAVRGKLGSIIQPWAMAADFAGNLGGDSAGVALDKTLAKSKDTTLAKIGNSLGDGMYELGESADAKAGKYGGSVQGISMALGMTSDMIAGKTFDQALNKAADAGKGSSLEVVGSAMGDAAFETVQAAKQTYDKGEKVVKEDLPALKAAVEERASEAYDKGKAVITEDLPALKNAVEDRAKSEYGQAREKLTRWWNN